MCSLIGKCHSKGGEGSVLVTIKKRKEGERERKNALQEGREKGQSLVNRASKHPQGSMANHILTRIYTRSVARKEGEEEVAATAEVPTIKWKKWKYVCPAFLRSHDNVWTANKRVATIGGANAHSRRDRLSFVTSFTLSNDTHCFWTRSYASRPGTWHRLEAGFIISFFFFFFPRSSSSARPCLHRANLHTRSFPSSLHRFAIIVFPASFSTVLVPSRRLNSIC